MREKTCLAAIALSVSLAPFAGPSALAQGMWITGSPLPTARSAMCAATGFDGRIFTIGGTPNGGGGSSVVEAYDPTTGTWAQRRPMPTPRYVASAAVGPDGRIYVAGGGQAGSVVVSAFEAYDPVTDTWSTLAPLPFGYASAGAAFGSDGRLFVMGGNRQTWLPIGQTLAYDRATNAWSMAAQMPTPRAGVAVVAALDGHIYAIGGVDESQNTVGTVEAYNPATDTWSARAPMPTPRTGMGAALGTDGRIHVVGGNTSQFQPVAQSVAEVYDPATNTWITEPSMPTARNNVAAAVDASGRIYILGGNPISGESLNTVEIFAPQVVYGVKSLFDQTRTHKSGSTVPIKLQLLDGNGINVSASTITVHAVSTTQVSGTPTGLLDDSGAANPDYDFRYDSTLCGYIFNLSLVGYEPGIYLIHFKAFNDPTDHTLQFQVR